jgi:hypothetical protein
VVLEQRIERERTKTVNGGRRGIVGSLDVRPRHKKLLEIEGWYEAPFQRDLVPADLLNAYDLWAAEGGRTKFTRWLLRRGRIDDKRASELGKVLKPINFKLSCRHNDLLRLAETEHYRSCFASWRGAQQLRYLADPDIAIVFVPDKAGKFLWRALVRLVICGGPTYYGLVVYRRYGDSNEAGIFRRLNQILPVFLAYQRGNGARNSSEQLRSATIANNEIIGKHVWSDHWAKLVNGRITMYAVPMTNTPQSQ